MDVEDNVVCYRDAPEGFAARLSQDLKARDLSHEGPHPDADFGNDWTRHALVGRRVHPLMADYGYVLASEPRDGSEKCPADILEPTACRVGIVKPNTDDEFSFRVVEYVEMLDDSRKKSEEAESAALGSMSAHA